MRLRLTWQYLLAFAALTVLCGTSHEFVHHFSAAAVCGEFGYKTFNSFKVAASCSDNKWTLLATAAGPLFTFGLMWWGMSRLRSPDAWSRALGFALIFANFPINRMLFVLINSNDEQFLARQLFAPSPLRYWVTVLLVWAACVPPLVVAWRAIGNRLRVLWFAGFFVLPFAFVIVFAGMFLENYLLLKQQFLATTVVGIPWLILLVEVLSLAIYYWFRPHLVNQPAAAGSAPLASQPA
jgi:hypothetical protein